jgi:hypothetical protein
MAITSQANILGLDFGRFDGADGYVMLRIVSDPSALHQLARFHPPP